MVSITRNGQELIFQVSDGILIQITPYFANSGLEVPMHDYLIGDPGNEMHVRASNGGIARGAVRAAVEELRGIIENSNVNLPVADINDAIANPFPDYADIQRLENMVWADSSALTNYREYAREYHLLATKYGESTLMEALEQYNNGKPW